MATTEFNKEYLQYTKEEAKKWHLYMGGVPELTQERPLGSFDWGKDVNFLYKIKESDVNFTTKRVDWQKRIVSTPWVATKEVRDDKLVFNPQNNIAYICVSDNKDNRSDPNIRGKNISVKIPNHKVGKETYEDGYTWHALFSVDPGNINLITNDAIPVPSVDDFSTEQKNTNLDYTFTQLCGADYKTTNGTCCLYNRYKFLDNAGITQEKGSLVSYRVISKCYECSDLASKLDCEYKFFSGVTAINLAPACSPCDCEYTIKSPIEKIGEQKQNLNPLGAYNFLYDSYENWKDNKKGIISVFMDLSDVDEGDKIVEKENPKVTFKTISGVGAEAELVTRPASNGKYLVTGIKLVTNGKNYDPGDATPIIDGNEDSPLNKKIEVNITPEDFPEVPHVMLNNMKTNIKINVDNTTIKNNAGCKISQFTKYGIIKNVKLVDNEIDASDSLNKDEFQVLRTTTVLTLSPSGTDNKISENPDLDFSPGEEVKLSDSEDKKGDVAYFKYTVNNDFEVTSATMEIISKNYDNIEVGDTIFINDNFEYVVDAINKPDVSFGTGTPLLVKDTSINFPPSDIADNLPQKAVTFNIKKS